MEEFEFDDLECNHTLGLFADYGRDILVTIDDLLGYQPKSTYTMQQLLDRRCATNLFHFEYCPKCGEKINWKELRNIKEISKEEYNEAFEKMIEGMIIEHKNYFENV